jgi:CheY-specific phosphatase CheX
MQSEHIGAVLGAAAENVLEVMFFTMAEGDADPVFPPGTHLIRTAMNFSGEWSGSFELQAPLDCARAIAENFAAADCAEEMPEETVAAVMCELASMVCGSTLCQLASDKIFDLGAPRVLSSIETDARPAANAVAGSRGLILGDGVVAFAMAIEAAA